MDLSSKLEHANATIAELRDQIARLETKCVPNLDDCTPEDLVIYESDFAQLHGYCFHRRTAMRYRANGNIRVASKLEARTDAVYATLPEWARW